jgi:hypothetical protein
MKSNRELTYVFKTDRYVIKVFIFPKSCHTLPVPIETEQQIDSIPRLLLPPEDCREKGVLPSLDS